MIPRDDTESCSTFFRYGAFHIFESISWCVVLFVFVSSLIYFLKHGMMLITEESNCL